MKTCKTILLTIGICCAVSGCDTLDYGPTDRYSDYTVWSTKNNVDSYMAGLYTSLRTFEIFGSRPFGTTDFNTDGLTWMMKYSSNTSGYGTPNLIIFNPTQITSAGSSLSYWKECYTRIRKVNEFLDGLPTCKVLSGSEKLHYEAEARYIRAYLYFILVRGHHSVIIYDRLGDWKHPDKARSSEAECWQFIYDELEFAYHNLADAKRTDGRVDKGCAAALMSRAMLYAERWDDVITAAQRVDEIGYTLDPSYAAVFNSTYSRRSPESIFQIDYKNENYCHLYDSRNAPSGDDATADKWCPGPTQEMVSHYETTTGSYIDWSTLSSRADLTTVYNMLEPRFHASVLYNGAKWKGRTIETFVGGRDGYIAYDSDGAPKTTVTGYYVKKYLDESNTEITTAKSTQSLVALRYAEVLLNHAEALIMSETQQNIADAMELINQVRSRVKLPDAQASDADEALAALKHEREIELAFEGFHYWDLKRWHDAHKLLDGVQFHAVKIEYVSSRPKFTQPSCDGANIRVFPEKYYSLPIPDAELTTNSLLTQLDEWL